MGRADHRAERLWRSAEVALAAYTELSSWKRQTVARFLTESRDGWRTYLHADLPFTPPNRPDAVLIGPFGVFAVLLRDTPPTREEAEEAIRFAGTLVLGARTPSGNVSEAVVRPVLVLPPAHPPVRHTASYLAVPASRLDQVLRKGERRLRAPDIRAFAEHLDRRGQGYRSVDLAESAADQTATAELLDPAELHRDRVDAARRGPFESWLTFLDDAQFGMVRREYSGPARISGPAGTGKSVVALHRLVHLGKRTVGPLLFATFAKNLPPIMRDRFARLAPELLDRAEFSTLHSWARQLLQDRKIPVDLDAKAAEQAFSMAWLRLGQHGKLSTLNPNPHYWRAEIDRVIKGRGMREVAEYQAVHRIGRGMGLERGADRQLVWDLCAEYDKRLRDKGKHDFNDIVDLAVAELRGRPVDPRYAAVVVDEVQDITLTGLRLLHLIAGDGPNRLLLVGDGQQQIYSGGWRLSDAGIPIRGRGEVLRTNYRNGARILEVAQRFDASNQVDDLDGAVGVSLREVIAALPGGTAIPWHGNKNELANAVLAVVRALGDGTDGDEEPVDRDDVAVLTFEKKDTQRWRGLLESAGFPVQDLDTYQGERNGTIKVGTVFRAKGLEFRAVVVPELPRPRDGDRSTEWQERGERASLVALTRARDYLWVGFADHS